MHPMCPATRSPTALCLSFCGWTRRAGAALITYMIVLIARQIDRTIDGMWPCPAPVASERCARVGGLQAGAWGMGPGADRKMQQMATHLLARRTKETQLGRFGPQCIEPFQVPFEMSVIFLRRRASGSRVSCWRSAHAAKHGLLLLTCCPS